MAGTEAEGKRRWRRALIGVYLVALLMGPGPGIYLINPTGGEGRPVAVFGMPVIYVWAVGWFIVMALTVVMAYRKLWSEDEAA